VAVTPSDEPSEAEWYWAVDIPGLTERQAKELVQLCEDAGIGEEVGCMPVDPRDFLTVALDRKSVEALVQALDGGQGRSGEADLLEVMAGWLDWHASHGGRNAGRFQVGDLVLYRPDERTSHPAVVLEVVDDGTYLIQNEWPRQVDPQRIEAGSRPYLREAYEAPLHHLAGR
jgi:hypothetical protein